MGTQDTAMVQQGFTDKVVAEWIAQKKTTGSVRTAAEYKKTMESFRQFISGLDELPITAQSEQDVSRHAVDITRVAVIWANTRLPARLKKDGTASTRFDDGSPVSPSMYNQRLAILSSFYAFVQDTYKLKIPNPIKDVTRRKVQAYKAADPIPPDEVEQGLESIDRSTKEGMRDYAILAVALRTGRRASEIAGTYGRDVKIQGRGRDTRIRITFHCKGNKDMKDLLSPDTSAVLLDYLYARFGKQLQAIPPDAPLWVSYSRNETNGKAIGIRTLSNIVAGNLANDLSDRVGVSLSLLYPQALRFEQTFDCFSLKNSVGYEALSAGVLCRGASLMGKSKKHRSPSPEWKNLEAQCLWPEQIAYEIIRPCQLEKQSITQRAVEVGLHPRTIARKLERFQQLGLPGLVPDSPDDTVDHRRLPLEVREEILRLKAEYPAFIAHEIAVICAMRFQRASDTRVVQHVLNTYPSPTQPERRFPRASEEEDSEQRRQTIIQLHFEGWTVKSIAG